MLLGIIKDTTNNIEYYINSEEKDNYSEITFVMVKEGTIKALSKEEVRKLLKTILSSNLTYKEKYNDYDVYLDEANNKRYFKNGTENLFMFLENNGVSAINCLEKISKKGKSKRYNIIVSAIVFDMILSSATLIPFAGDIHIRENIDTTISSIMPITTNELVNTIQTSQYLTDEEKEILCNEEYFEFVLEYSDSNRNYNLRQNLSNVNIEYFNSSENEIADGYTDPLHPNTIYILNKHTDDNELSDAILIHEFIHLTQNNNLYSYIKESCDEIIKNEFYQKDIIAYSECVKRTKILMEIIGPEPVIECNFKSSSKSFTDAVKEYLPEDEANDLLYLLCTPASTINDPNFDSESLNAQIDKYLAKMYKSKTGNDIKDDILIRSIYNDLAKNRVYFNQSLENYNKDFAFSADRKLIGILNTSEVINSDEVEYFEYLYPQMIGNYDTSVKHDLCKTTDFSTIPEEDSLQVRVYFNDGTYGSMSYSEEENSWSDIKHYEIIHPFEPSIPKKFPEQMHNSIKYKPTYEKEQSEAKLI